MNKDKMSFIERYEQLQKEKQFEQQLKDQPLFEDELSVLGYDVVSRNNDMVKDLRDRGLIVRRPYPTLQEFVEQAKGYVVKQSALFQMERDEFRTVRQSGALNGKVEIYNDLDDNRVPLHYKYQSQQHNGKYESRQTGGSQMVNVAYETLNEQESEANAMAIRNVQISYDKARQEIDFILNNLEAVANGSVNTQYHDSVGRE